MRAVFLDYKDINIGDISWEPLENLCSLRAFEGTIEEETASRIGDAEIVFMDSAPISRATIEKCQHLKYIGIAATGFNHIDLEAAREKGIAVTNVPGYSTSAVSQHAISLLLQLSNRVSYFDKVHRDAIYAERESDQWGAVSTQHYRNNPLTLLDGKSIGIIGYGNIGSRVARIAEAFGMKVNIYSRDRESAIKSDVLSLHCPLTPENKGMIDADFISQMKDGAILINTARGGLVDEADLAKALKSGKLAAAGLDVTANEPPKPDCPLLDCENCIITPHMAFMPTDTRKHLLDVMAENLKSFYDGGRLNRID